MTEPATRVPTEVRARLRAQEREMKLPKHVNLTIEHQPHAIYYMTVEQWLNNPNGNAFLSAPCRGDVTAEDRAEMIRTGEVWTILWYPDTSSASCQVWAATLTRALELLTDDEQSTS